MSIDTARIAGKWKLPDPSPERWVAPAETGTVRCARCSWTFEGVLVPDGVERFDRHREEAHPAPPPPPREPPKWLHEREAKRQAFEDAIASLKATGVEIASAREIAARTNGVLSSHAVGRYLTKGPFTAIGDASSRRWRL